MRQKWVKCSLGKGREMPTVQGCMYEGMFETSLKPGLKQVLPPAPHGDSRQVLYHGATPQSFTGGVLGRPSTTESHPQPLTGRF